MQVAKLKFDRLGWRVVDKHNHDYRAHVRAPTHSSTRELRPRVHSQLAGARAQAIWAQKKKIDDRNLDSKYRSS